MSCWVVPAIAAEFWRVPVEQVMDKIRRNAVPIRREDGFIFVDILPGVGEPPAAKGAERPSTFEAAPARVAEPDAGVVAPHVQARGDWVSMNPGWRLTASLRRSPSRA